VLRIEFIVFTSAVLLAPSARGQAQSEYPMFAGPQYRAGAAPRALVAADFDLDGRTDVAIANLESDDVSVLLGNGHGKLAAPVHSPLQALEPRAMASADLDGNGRLDLVTCNFITNDVSVLRGHPAGVFAHGGNWNVGMKPRALVLGNLDGHPAIDIAVANRDSNDIIVLHNDGTAGFTSSFAWQLGDSPRALTAGDVDNDSDLDLITTYFTQGWVVVLLNDGLGGFTLTNQGLLPPSVDVFSLLAKDVTADGNVDLVVGAGAWIKILVGNGAGSFSAWLHVNTFCTAQNLAYGDLDGNGERDLVSAEWDCGTIRILYGLGNGAFSDGVPVTVASSSQDVAFGEFNGDGVADLAVADGGWGATLLLSGGPKYGVPPQYPLAAPSPNSLELADVDADGDLDAVTSHGAFGALAVAKNDGRGQFAPAGSVATAQSASQSLALGFVDGDAYVDAVVLGGLQSEAVIHFGTTGGFGPAAMSAPLGVVPWRCAVGDLDNDGAQDLVATNPYSNELTSALGDGTGKFGAPITSAGATRNTYLALAHMDGDAKLDAITAGYSGDSTPVSVSVHRGDGVGGFAVASSIPLAGRAAALATGDFNGDGHIDAAVANWSPGTLQVVFGDGNDNLLTLHPVIPTPLTSAHQLVAADVDRDGVLDLAAANEGHNVVIHFGDGHGLFPTSSSFTGARQPRSLAVADVNGDGAIDITTANLGTHALSVFLHGYGETIGYCTAGTTANGCAAMVTGIGSASATATSGYELRVTGIEGQRATTLFYGVNGRIALPWASGSTSFLCVASPVQRMLVTNSGGTLNACNGALTVDFNAYLASHPTALGQPMSTGQFVQAQAWFRDPPSPKHTSLSSAVEFTLLP
jgi:hypothetical protein